MEEDEVELKRLKESLESHLATIPGVSTDPGDYDPINDNLFFPSGQALTMAKLQELLRTLKSSPNENQLAPNPLGLQTPLMHHQQHALAWLLWREQQTPAGGILADDMGLGKTLTMISLVLSTTERCQNIGDSEISDFEEDDWRPILKRNKNGNLPAGKTLVVCPASLLAQWQNEVHKHCRKNLLRTKIYHGANRESQSSELTPFDIVITTYHIVARGIAPSKCPLRSIKWQRVILDEAHIIRNHKTTFCQSVCGLKANKKWALTGTPIQNKALDMYSILKFLQCAPFDDLKVWQSVVRENSDSGHKRVATLMKAVMLRRTKIELMAKGLIEPLPDKNIETIHFDLDENEREVYDKLLAYSQTLLAEFLRQQQEKINGGRLGTYTIGAGPSWKPTSGRDFSREVLQYLAKSTKELQNHKMIYILVLILRLRQVCCHASLVNAELNKEEYEHVGLQENALDDKSSVKKMKEKLGDKGGSVLSSENPVFERKRVSSKMKKILKKVKEILDKDEKLIIVSQWTGYLDIVAEHLEDVEDATWAKFTGAVNVRDRQDVVEDFNNELSDPKILLLSLTAGGVGLNLVGGNHMLLIDIHWNPQLEGQCQDRIYRFGQKKNVWIYKFICNDSIEEKVRDLQDHKLKIAKDILTPGADRATGNRLTMSDIKKLFGM